MRNLLDVGQGAIRPLLRAVRSAATWAAQTSIGMKRFLQAKAPGVLVLLVVVATLATVAWLHSAAKTSPDAWPSSVAAGTTVALALITLWYAYITHRLLQAQMLAPRASGWESASRDLSVYLNKERALFWSAEDYFPANNLEEDPPDIMALAETKVSFARVRDHLLEVLGLLPRRYLEMVLPLTMELVNAEGEVMALFQAITEAMETSRAAGGTTWTWDDARAAHDASSDPDRAEVWDDVCRGRYFHEAERLWDELSTAVDNDLTGSRPSRC